MLFPENTDVTIHICSYISKSIGYISRLRLVSKSVRDKIDWILAPIETKEYITCKNLTACAVEIHYIRFGCKLQQCKFSYIHNFPDLVLYTYCFPERQSLRYDLVKFIDKSISQVTNVTDVDSTTNAMNMADNMNNIRFIHLINNAEIRLCTFITPDMRARIVIDYTSQRLANMRVFTAPKYVKIWDLIDYYIEYESTWNSKEDKFKPNNRLKSAVVEIFRNSAHEWMHQVVKSPEMLAFISSISDEDYA